VYQQLADSEQWGKAIFIQNRLTRILNLSYWTLSSTFLTLFSTFDWQCFYPTSRKFAQIKKNSFLEVDFWKQRSVKRENNGRRL